MTAKNTKAAADFAQAYNTRKFDLAIKHLAPEGVFTDQALGQSFKGEAEYRDLLTLWSSAFTDSKMSELEWSDAGDTIVAQFRFTGTNDGPFGALPATGKRVSIPACMIWQFDKSNHVLEQSVYYDALSFMAQLGHVTPPPMS